MFPYFLKSRLTLKECFSKLSPSERWSERCSCPDTTAGSGHASRNTTTRHSFPSDEEARKSFPSPTSTRNGTPHAASGRRSSPSPCGKKFAVCFNRPTDSYDIHGSDGEYFDGYETLARALDYLLDMEPWVLVRAHGLPTTRLLELHTGVADFIYR